MNIVIEAINKRRSIRSYDAWPVPRELVNAVIAAGNEAPSLAMNPGASAIPAHCCGVSERLE